MTWWTTIIGTALDLVYPEHCLVCGAARDGRAWTAAGARVRGLARWDATHLCAGCAKDLAAPPRWGAVDAVPVVAAQPEGATLVALVGACKYRGLRGVAWPLGRLLGPAAQAARARYGDVDALVPVPLHPRRQRERGFNQAALLAGVVAVELGLRVDAHVLARRRATGQQASLPTEGSARDANVAGVFVAREVGDARVALVDDLVTTGATWRAARDALADAGWTVAWGLALGLAARLDAAEPASLDTPEAHS